MAANTSFKAVLVLLLAAAAACTASATEVYNVKANGATAGVYISDPSQGVYLTVEVNKFDQKLTGPDGILTQQTSVYAGGYVNSDSYTSYFAFEMRPDLALSVQPTHGSLQVEVMLQPSYGPGGPLLVQVDIAWTCSGINMSSNCWSTQYVNQGGYRSRFSKKLCDDPVPTGSVLVNGSPVEFTAYAGLSRGGSITINRSD